jgi:pyroglutamyl-peptidase
VILLTGFGPFAHHASNPSADLVRAAHGLSVRGHRIVGRVLWVRWDAAVPAALDEALRLRPALMVGFGLAADRDRVTVEAVGRRARAGADVEGRWPTPVQDGPDVPATADVERLAAALGGAVSHDAGTYLCNAWATEVVAAVPCPAAFVHLPPEGLAVGRLLGALDGFLGPTLTRAS